MIDEIDDKQDSELPEDGAAEEKKSGPAEAPEFETDKMSGAALTAMRARQEHEEQELKEDAQAHKLGLQARLLRLDVGERAKQARMGDQETRMILIKDSSKQVALAVLGNPKLTLHEVEMIAASRNVSEEVLREIAGNKDWIKSYSVTLALVNNPKTPVPMGLTFLPKLRTRDLRFVGKNKGVPEVIRMSAKRLAGTRSF
ncbi:MAG: hypothetical protein WA666_02895 [Nitrospirota bacterium]